MREMQAHCNLPRTEWRINMNLVNATNRSVSAVLRHCDCADRLHWRVGRDKSLAVLGKKSSAIAVFMVV